MGANSGQSNWSITRIPWGARGALNVLSQAPMWSRWTASALVFLVAGSAWAGGFEKATMFSGKWAPLGGAAAAGVSGAESVYFNPAGLGGVEGFDLSVNLSPTYSQFSGPVATEDIETSKPGVSPIAGLFLSKGLTDRIGFGLGAYVSAGSSSAYEDLRFDDVQKGLNSDESDLISVASVSDAFDQLRPDTGTSLRFLEVSPAVGIRLTDSLRLGVGWRALTVSGELRSAKVKQANVPVNAVLVNATLGGLSGHSLMGWRAGLQYTPTESFGLGLSVRGPMTFTLEGTTSGLVEAGNQSWAEVYDLEEGTVEAGTGLPLQASLGAMFKVGDRLTFFPEYTFTQYSANEKIELEGEVILPPELTGAESPLSDLVLGWGDRHQGRLGIQYELGDRTLLRGGYVYTNQGTPAERARATSTAPAATHTITVGAGFRNLGWALGLDGIDVGAEYSTASGDGTNDLGVDGTFTNTFVGLHTGFQFRF